VKFVCYVQGVYPSYVDTNKGIESIEKGFNLPRQPRQPRQFFIFFVWWSGYILHLTPIKPPVPPKNP
jgi:hypothetical protein